MESTSTKPNLSILSGLQAFLQILIMLYHFFSLHSPFGWTLNPQKQKSDTYAANLPAFPVNGYTAVGLFFALSGFMAGFTSFKRFSTLNRKNYFTYIIKRFSRLSFLYYASLLLGIVCIFGKEWRHMSLLQLTIVVPGVWFWNSDLVTWNAPLWFVSQLMCFYFIAPAMIRLLRQRSKSVLLAGLFLCYAIPFAGFFAFWKIKGPVVMLGGKSNWVDNPAQFFEAFVNQGPYFNILQFLAGIILGIFAQRFPFKPPQGVVDFLGFLFFSSLVICGSFCHKNNQRFLGFMYWDRFLMFPLYSAWFFLMTMESGTIAKIVFENDIMQSIGKFSYALYVIHNPVWRWLRIDIDNPIDHPIYKYAVFNHQRFAYMQFPFAMLAAFLWSWAFFKIDQVVSPKINNFLMRLFMGEKSNNQHDTRKEKANEKTTATMEMA